jgi:predicted Zn-dependent peptidase
MEYYTHQLSNGIRIIHAPVNSEVAHCGLIINAGSRDEKAGEQGIAHFVEHLFFKGTRKRKAFHILSRMDDVGGEINAYTSKEETCIHTSFLNKDYERSLELLSDITFNSIFPHKEMLKEKDVIIDEINSYKDNPAEAIYDDFEELVFEGQPLGRNILGTPEMLQSFSKDDIENFIERTYLPHEMVITSIGHIPFDRLIKLSEKHFGHITGSSKNQKRVPFNGYVPQEKTLHRQTNQAHCILGNIAPDLYDPRRITMTLLENLIAGPGLNSRLNMLLREKLGYVYHVESSYTPFSDTGLFTLYFGAEKSRVNKTIEHINREFERLRTIPLGKVQLRKAKRQLFGQLAITSENPSVRMIANGKSYLMLKRVDSLDEIREKIEAITAEELMDTAREVLDPKKLSTLTYL